MKQTYTIHLAGPGIPDAHRLPGALVRDLFDALDRGARGAVRLRLEGRSAAKGPQPGWLDRAARFDLLDLTSDAPGLRIAAPELRDALRDRFEQTDLFADHVAKATGISLFAEGLADAVRGRSDSEAYDEGLLRTYERLSKVFGRDVETIELRNGRPDVPPLTVTPQGIQVVEQLHRRTPRPQRVRLAGKLDAIRYSDRAFTLVLRGGTGIRGVLTDADAGPGALAEHFGHPVLVSGTGFFKPSGALQAIEAERVERASDDDLRAWSQAPQSLFVQREAREFRRPQGPRSGLNAIFGKWPGEESDEEIEHLLDELS
ncbi:MAG TPA: hypothetical protein VGE02_08000 [Gemmatimonadales bacterium]